MVNAKNVSTETELAEILARCGYASKPSQASPAWEEWKAEWGYAIQKRRVRQIPSACYLSDISSRAYMVAVHDKSFQLYEQIRKGDWFILLAELQGDIHEEELCVMVGFSASSLDDAIENAGPETPCQCLYLPLSHIHYRDIRFVGVDKTHGRFGEVSIKRCRHCGRYWLHYSVVYEHLPESGRYFMGLITPELAEVIKPEAAVGYLESQHWVLYGGSYFLASDYRGKGRSTSKKIPVE